jgi:hypothetical protein
MSALRRMRENPRMPDGDCPTMLTRCRMRLELISAKFPPSDIFVNEIGSHITEIGQHRIGRVRWNAFAPPDQGLCRCGRRTHRSLPGRADPLARERNGSGESSTLDFGPRPIYLPLFNYSVIQLPRLNLELVGTFLFVRLQREKLSGSLSIHLVFKIAGNVCMRLMILYGAPACGLVAFPGLI